MNLVQVFAMPPLSRLGQRQISSSMVQDFVECFCAMSDTNLCMSIFLTVKYAYLNRYPRSKLAQQRLMRQDGPRVTHSELPAAFLLTLSHWHSHKKQNSFVQVFAMPPLSRLGQRQISSSMVQDFVEIFWAMSDTNLCMSTFMTLKYTYLNKYARSKLAQQRLMLQDGPRVTHSERLAAFVSRLCHWHRHKKHMNLVQVFAMPPLSRLGQRQIMNQSSFCWIVPCHVRKQKNLCMITKLQYTCLNGQCRYACSTETQQRLMRQDGPRGTHPNPQNVTGLQPSAFGGCGTHAAHWREVLVKLGCWPDILHSAMGMRRQSRGGRFTMIYQDMTVQQRTLRRHLRGHLI